MASEPISDSVLFTAHNDDHLEIATWSQIQMTSPHAWLTPPKLASSPVLQHTTEIIILEKAYLSDVSEVPVHDLLVGLGASGACGRAAHVRE